MILSRVTPFALLALALASPALAATVFVANNGVDSGNCGDKKAPCRTITQGLALAGAGDTVLVGPGRYGDLDHDGKFTSPGEETPNIGSCLCVVAVAKPVKLYSRDGASATVIDVGTSDFSAVVVTANGAEVGKKKQGFTVTGGFNFGGGIGVDGNDTAVRANIARGTHGGGFFSNGARNSFVGNLAHDCDTGFSFGETSSANVVKLNRASGTESTAFTIAGTGHTVVDDAADGSRVGFIVSGSGHVLRGLVAVGNEVGISLGAGGLTVADSSATGNDIGIAFSDAGNAVVTNSVIVGNDSTIPNTHNCGLLVDAGSSVTATGNWWGAASGPGPDPADAVCTSGNGSATTDPAAAKEPKVKVKAGF